MSNLLTLYNETNEVVGNAIRQAAQTKGQPLENSEITRQSKLWIRYEFEMAAQEFYQKRSRESNSTLTINLTRLMAVGLVFSFSSEPYTKGAGLLAVGIGMLGLPVTGFFSTSSETKTNETMKAQVSWGNDANDFHFVTPDKLKRPVEMGLARICDDATTALVKSLAFPERMQRRIQEAVKHYKIA